MYSDNTDRRLVVIDNADGSYALARRYELVAHIHANGWQRAAHGFVAPHPVAGYVRLLADVTCWQLTADEAQTALTQGKSGHLRRQQPDSETWVPDVLTRDCYDALTSLDVDMFAQAADLVDRGWTQQTLAAGADGMPAHPTSPDATAWCMVGAVCATHPDLAAGDYDLLGQLTYSVERLLEPRLDDRCPTDWNDDEERTEFHVAAFLRECAADKKFAENFAHSA